MSDNKLPKFTEFEVKYRSELSLLPLFQKIAENIPNLKKFLYTYGPDKYYINSDDNSFVRLREAKYPADGFKQWTIKQKPSGAKNNIQRFEANWRVDNTPTEELEAGVLASGFVFNFQIHKTCFIYSFEDATIVMYFVREDGYDKEDVFVEIEVTEETIHELTEEQAWNVITKYEKLLEPIGVSPQKRMKKSLFELYKKNVLTCRHNF